jgi:hypothetical protein
MWSISSISSRIRCTWVAEGVLCQVGVDVQLKGELIAVVHLVIMLAGAVGNGGGA